MTAINFKKEVNLAPEEAVTKITPLLQKVGFGILTRIDFHLKMKEKLGKDIPPVIILGACNPQLAFDAYQVMTDITSLIPCNVVIREIKPGRVSVEIAKASSMMQILGDSSLLSPAKNADEALLSALNQLS